MDRIQDTGYTGTGYTQEVVQLVKTVSPGGQGGKYRKYEVGRHIKVQKVQDSQYPQVGGILVSIVQMYYSTDDIHLA